MNKILTYFTLIIVLISCQHKKENYQKVKKEPIFQSADSIPNAHYVGSKKCAECHADQFKDWKNSEHDLSMQTANRQTILAPFEGEKHQSQGVNSHFFQKEGLFYANTEGPDGKNHDYQIIYAFGVTPLQQYIVQFPNGHFQCLRTAFDTVKKEWYDLYPDFKVVHSEWLHWSRGGLNWNTMCADCHSTNVKKNYNETNHSYDTDFALINVSCEACHGPGKNHVENAIKKGNLYESNGDLEMVGLSPKALVDDCARCHARRESFSLLHNHEGTFADHYYPQLIEAPFYHEDGQIKDEVYVYGSFIQSKMYHNNVTCTNCHDPHTTKLKFEDNRLCMQCHEGTKFNTPSHHKHAMGSESALCINCHMPGKTYMGNDFRRDHSFRIPRPDLSLTYNTPNACAGCHTDKNKDQVYKDFVSLYGLPKKNHFSDKLAPGILGNPHGNDSLIKLAKDTIYPNMARASAIINLKNYANQIQPKQVIAFLNDTSDLVQGAAVDVLADLNLATKNYESLLPLLNHPKRSIRVKTFYALAEISSTKIPEKYKNTYGKVRIEFANYLKSIGDFSGGKLKRAQYYIKINQKEKAIAILEKGLEQDDLNNVIRTNLANLYYQTKNYDKAAKTYQHIIDTEPGFGMTNFDYGLLLNEMGNKKEALHQLEKAHEYLPKNNRVVYNLALLYFQNKQNSKAISVLTQQLKQAENNTDLLYLLAYIQQQNGNKPAAKKLAEKLLQLAPNNPTYLQLYRVVE